MIVDVHNYQLLHCRSPFHFSEAVILRILMSVNRDLKYIVEQPAQSWAFKQAFMQQVLQAGGLLLVPGDFIVEGWDRDG